MSGQVVKEFTAEQRQSESITAPYWVPQQREPESYPAYIGLDVHKKTIVVTLVWLGRGPAELWGEIAHTTEYTSAPVAASRCSVRRYLDRHFTRGSVDFKLAVLLTSTDTHG